MNTVALTLPKEQLLDEVEKRIAWKQEEIAERDARYGAERKRIFSYMENLGWPELFGFDMPRYLAEAEFSVEQNLRQMIFWADNVKDDVVPNLSWMGADVGMYWDMTLFGEQITHSPIGVPEFHPHPIHEQADIALLGHFDFYHTGVMPQLIEKYQRMQEISRQDYGGKIYIGFPCFHRGPLDIYVQLRGYENFIDDITEREDYLTEALTYIMDERYRFMQERRRFLQEAEMPATSFMADDWVNIPFITPTFFREVVVPVYAHVRAQEGPITGFHTCGNMEAVTRDLLKVFPEITGLDLQGWNDIRKIDALVAPHISFSVGFINTVTLGDAPDEQREKIAAIRALHPRRPVSINAGAIVKLYPTYEETLTRLNHFLLLAHEELNV